MTSSNDEPVGPGGVEDVSSEDDTRPTDDDSNTGTGPTELPDKGYIADEQLPEDLQPTDDNPLAKNPGEDDEDEEGGEPPKVEGMPDMGDPGSTP